MRGIQLSYSTLRDILNDESLSESMVVYALSLDSLDDHGGSYYEIVTRDKMIDIESPEEYRLKNGYYARPFKTNSYDQDLETISEIVEDTDQLLETVKDTVGEVNGYIDTVIEKLDKLSSEVKEGLDTLDDDTDGVAECIGELCDECLTLYSKALQLKNTSMGDINLVDLVPIIDSDVDNVAADIGELMDTDYSLENRIKKLENKMKEIDPDFDPDNE